jgi:DNA-binding FadR family transcriptional regulator
VELDYQFHAWIFRASGRRTLYEAWMAISGKVRLYLAATNLVYPSQQEIAQGHRAILEAIRAKNPRRADKAMQTHLREMLQLFVTKVIRKAPDAAAGRTARPAEVAWARKKPSMPHRPGRTPR